MNIVVFNETNENYKLYSFLRKTFNASIFFIKDSAHYEKYKSLKLETHITIVIDDLSFFVNVVLEGVVYLKLNNNATLNPTFFYNVVMNMNLYGIIVESEDVLYNMCDNKFFFLKSRRNKNGHCMLIAYNEAELETRIKSDVYDFKSIIDVQISNSYKIPIYTFVINLEKCTERKKNILKLIDPALHNINFFKAKTADSCTLEEKNKIFRLTEQFLYIKKNPYGYIKKPGEYGCALSHVSIWKDIVEKVDTGILDEKEIICVFEDDITLTSRYSEKLVGIINSLSVTSWDFCFLGHTDDIPGIDKIVNFNENVSLVRMNGLSKRTHAGGSFAYLINYKGARKFLACIDKYGIIQAIDWFLFEMTNDIEMYKTYPHLVLSDIISTDSTIQN